MDLQELKTELIAILKSSNYSALQYIPTRKSKFGLFKIGENLSNLIFSKKHLMFYYATYPSFYINLVTLNNKKLKFLYEFCFKNYRFSKNSIEKYIGTNWFNNAVYFGLILQSEEEFKLNFSVVPYNNYYIIRDPFQDYSLHQLDPKTPINRVWLGSDSIHFAQLNLKHLKNKYFKNVLELGSGTGIQLIAISEYAEKLEGIDINPQAVSLTNLNSKINGLSQKISASESDLFLGLDGKYDLILANPWFIDIEKDGLEEIPNIVIELDNYLLPEGSFVMYFSSFVKDGVDYGLETMITFSKNKRYEAVFYNLGRNIDEYTFKNYKSNNISFLNTWYCILNKNDKNKVTIHKRPFLRRIRDAVFIPIQRFTLSKNGK